MRMPEGLAPLTGWGWRVFAAAWTMLLAAALAAAIGIVPAMIQAVAAPVNPAATYGVTVVANNDDVRLAAPFGPALASGLRPGDHLIAVQGRPAAFSADSVDRQFAAAAGGPVAIVTADLTGRRSAHVLRRESAAADRALAAVGLSEAAFRLLNYLLGYAGETLLLIACATLLMARRSHDPLAPWASVTMLLLVIGNGRTGDWLAEWFPDPLLVHAVLNAVAFGMINVVLALFPNGRFEPRWSVPVAAGGMIATIAAEPQSNAVSNVVLVATMLAAVAAVIVRQRRISPGAGRQQIRWALLGFAGSMTSLALLALEQGSETLVRSYGAFAWLNLAGGLLNAGFLMLLMVAMTVALLRWRLYDADATISRSVSYGVLTVGLLAVFAGSEKLFEITGERLFGEQLGAAAGALGAAAAAVTIVPLHHRATQWAERRFRSGLAHLRHGLPVLVGDLRETASPAALADTMLARVEAGVRARHGAVVAGDTVLDARDVALDAVAGWLGKAGLPADGGRGLLLERGDPLFPVRVALRADGAGLIGWLLLGPRPDGSFYGREERAALAEVAEPVARALAIALHRAAREAERRIGEEGLRREMGELRRLVRALEERIGTGLPAGAPA